MKILIGHTGFVGSNILAQTEFDNCYNSKNIEEIRNKKVELIVCAGVSGTKWKANKYPQEDCEQILRLINNLEKVKFKKLVLISTIAVYDNPVENAYGRNRLFLETYIQTKYPNSLIVRLPALFGDGIKKNPIYDLLNKQHQYLPNFQSKFQYYYLGNIWKDITVGLNNDLKILNITSEPIVFCDILKLFSKRVVRSSNNLVVEENMKSVHSQFWGKHGDYLYDSNEVIDELRGFIKKYDSV